MSRINLNALRKMKTAKQKITMLTAYDSTFSYMLDEAGIDVILVGDSLGMVVQGHETTLPVTVDDMIYHTKNVVRGAKNAFIIADLPFMSYNNVEQALINAGRLMAEGGAQMVKLEGGANMADTVYALTQHGIPVCVHLGLLPQSVNRIGGYIVQGRDPRSAETLLNDAILLEQAGADMLLLECVPAGLAEKITEEVFVPVIGIGASKACDGQVLVSYDMLGLTPGVKPKFNRNFLATSDSIQDAIVQYVEAVKAGGFPSEGHQY